MSKELKKRVVTSILLLMIAILCIVISKIIFTFAIFIIFAICFYEWDNINTPYFFIKRKKKRFFLIQLAGSFYLFIFLASSIYIYNSISEIFFIYIILICVCSDMGGYIFGKMIGGKKLTKISPNKTIAGSVGSFIFSIVPLFLFNFKNYQDVSLSLKHTLFCLVISLSCQLGDLIVSYFKRLNKVKDTGNILPGHGGLLDRIDGIIFAIPVVCILKITQIF